MVAPLKVEQYNENLIRFLDVFTKKDAEEILKMKNEDIFAESDLLKSKARILKSQVGDFTFSKTYHHEERIGADIISPMLTLDPKY